MRQAVSLAGLCAVLLTACGEPEQPRSSAYENPDRGYSASVPEGWQRARHVVDSQVVNPRELLVVSTFEMGEHGEDCGPFYDAQLEHMGDAEALVAVRERLGSTLAGPPDYPQRPERFRLEPSAPERVGCGLGSHRMVNSWWIPFSDAGRDFYAQVDIGLEAPDAVRQEAAALLDSLRFDH